MKSTAKRICLINLLAFAALGVNPACSAQEQTVQEKPKMQKPPTPSGPSAPPISASRAAPPVVRFITFEGIKYRQVLDATKFGKEQRTGYLAAYPEDGDEPEWLLKVYETTKVDHLEQDVQDVFFKSMELDAEHRQLLIENELGNKFVVDIDNRTVK